MISLLWLFVNVAGKYAEVLFVFDVYCVAPTDFIIILLYLNSSFLLDCSSLLVPAN